MAVNLQPDHASEEYDRSRDEKPLPQNGRPRDENESQDHCSDRTNDDEAPLRPRSPLLHSRKLRSASPSGTRY
jgi:hypothetical protein